MFNQPTEVGCRSALLLRAAHDGNTRRIFQIPAGANGCPFSSNVILKKRST